MFYNLTKNYNKFINSIGPNIINGPFKGMKYISESVGSCHMPKILGIYENEIYPTFLNFLRNSDLFVDIGAAEGYYAVGSAIKYPNLNVIAFEMDKTGRQYISNLKKRNNVDNVEIREKFSDVDFFSIQKSAYNRITYLIDIEGEEINIFSKYHNHFNNSYFIIEIHDRVSNEIESYLKRFYSNTHNTYIIPIKDKSISDLSIKIPTLLKLFKNKLIYKHLLSEWREYEQSFLVCEPIIG